MRRVRLVASITEKINTHNIVGEKPEIGRLLERPEHRR
jgi:hypothetical protein